jgi:NADH-quinone oxidoreductase subunit A
MAQYLPILAIFVLAAVFATVSLAGSRLLGPSRPTAAKQAPYECGIVPNRGLAQRFPVRFYLVAMIFIIFDIEIIFLYPWAVIYRQLDVFGLVEMVVFSVAVVVSLAYLLSNGAIDWGPARRLARTVSPTRMRSSTSTIRRVPRPTMVQSEPEPGLEPEDGGASEDQPRPEAEPATSRP